MAQQSNGREEQTSQKRGAIGHLPGPEGYLPKRRPAGQDLSDGKWYLVIGAPARGIEKIVSCVERRYRRERKDETGLEDGLKDRHQPRIARPRRLFPAGPKGQ